MKKRMVVKRIAALLSAACLVGNVPDVRMTAYAADAVSTVTDGTYTDADEGIIYSYRVDADGNAELYKIKDYEGKNINVPAQVDGHTVTRLTFQARSGSAGVVTIPETIMYMDAAAFGWLEIDTLNYNAPSATTTDDVTSVTPFHLSKIKNFSMASTVVTIPDRMFSNTEFQQDELVINSPTVCKKAFWKAKFNKLTIGENVRNVGINAFAYADIGELYWNAAVAETYGDGATALNAPFAYATIGNASFGRMPSSIPDYFLGGAEAVTLSALEIPASVTSIGKGAFKGCKIERLNYNATNAVAEEPEYTTDTMLYDAEIGELGIGSGVKSLPYGFMCEAKLTQDEIVIPDSVESIGSYAFFAGLDSGGISIGTLEIGKNATKLGNYIFGNCIIGKCVIKLLRAPGSMTSYASTQPKCGSVESHKIGVYFNYFKAKTEPENVKVLCSKFTTTHLWQYEFYDADKDKFSHRVDVKCAECGDMESHWEYRDAVTVIFTNHDGTELSRQNLLPGKNATAPVVPAREGWRFTGWDKEFTNVTENVTVSALFEEVTNNNSGDSGNSGDGGDSGNAGTGTGTSNGDNTDSGNNSGGNTDSGNNSGGNHAGSGSNSGGDNSGNSGNNTGGNSSGNTGNNSGNNSGSNSGNNSGNSSGSSTGGNTWTDTRVYTVTFVDGNKVLAVRTVRHGKDADAPAAATRPDEAWGTWRFTGWSGNYKNVTKNETVSAVFEKVLNEYEVVFYDADGNVLSRQTVSHGGKPEIPQPPEKAADTKHTYTFREWSADTENITSDCGFRPVYVENPRIYNVTFLNGKKILAVCEVVYGESAVAPPNPTKKADAKYTYVFAGWDADFRSVTEDMTVHAVFTAKKKTGTDGQDKDKTKDKDKDKTKDKDKNTSKDKDSGKNKPTDNGKHNGNGNTDTGRKPSGQNVSGNGDTGTGRKPSGQTGGGTAAGQQGNGGNSPAAFTPPDRKPGSVNPVQKPGSDSKTAPSGKKPDADAAATKTDSGLSDDKPESGQKQKPEQPETEKKPTKPDSVQAEKDTAVDMWDAWENQDHLWFVFCAACCVAVVAAISALCLLLFRRRKIRGTVLDADGRPASEVFVTLHGEDAFAACTDGRGEFCFDGLKKGEWTLEICRGTGKQLLCADIRIGARDGEEPFKICSSNCLRVDFGQEKNDYVLNVKL